MEKFSKMDQIDAVIEKMFDVKNDQMMMKCFCYRRHLNLTPREVGKELKISRIKVNLLIQAIPHKRLNSGSFALGYLTTIEAVGKFAGNAKMKEYEKILESCRKKVNQKRLKLLY